MRRVSLMLIAGLVVGACVLCAHAQAERGGEGDDQAIVQHGRPIQGAAQSTAHECITAAERTAIRARIEANRERLGIPMFTGGVAGSTREPLYPFYPQGVMSNRDGIDINFVDLDPSAGILDFRCGIDTYDGHRGDDRYLRTFDEQVIGVPVFAALDGVVIDAHDGEPDMNTVPLGQLSNYVIIDHGFGIEAWYLHLANGSVLPSVGEFVREGEQVGLTASSGNSAWPHLHFETFFLGETFEPFAGPCRAGASGWEMQDSYASNTFLYNFGLTSQDLPSAPPLPERLPVNAQILTTDQNLYFWFQVANLPLQTTWRVVFTRPNASVAYDSGTQPFDNDFAARSAWFWFWYPIPNFIPDVATTPGTWHVDFYLAGVHQAHAPFEVVTVVNPGFNRAPESITAAFQPATPNLNGAIRCKVTAPVLIADKDYDVVQFRYEWKVNGGTVRDMTTAGHADVLQRSMAQAGDTVSVTVTPSDGATNGTPVTIQHTFASACLADIVTSATFQPPPDGQVDGADLAYLLGQWGACE